MANTRHPLDIEVDNMDITRKALVRLISRDGHVDEEERYVLHLVTGHQDNVSGYRMREEAADSWKRNGNTRITRDRFEDCGFGLIDLDAERRARESNVVPFPTRSNAG